MVKCYHDYSSKLELSSNHETKITQTEMMKSLIK